MKYVCPCGYVYDETLGDPKTASLPALSGKTSPKTGFAPYAVLIKTLLRKSNLFNAKMPTYGKMRPMVKMPARGRAIL